MKAKLVAGNWKMNGLSGDLIETLKKRSTSSVANCRARFRKAAWLCMGHPDHRDTQKRPPAEIHIRIALMSHFNALGSAEVVDMA